MQSLHYILRMCSCCTCLHVQYVYFITANDLVGNVSMSLFHSGLSTSTRHHTPHVTCYQRSNLKVFSSQANLISKLPFETKNKNITVAIHLRGTAHTTAFFFLMLKLCSYFCSSKNILKLTASPVNFSVPLIVVVEQLPFPQMRSYAQRGRLTQSNSPKTWLPQLCNNNALLHFT